MEGGKIQLTRRNKPQPYNLSELFSHSRWGAKHVSAKRPTWRFQLQYASCGTDSPPLTPVQTLESQNLCEIIKWLLFQATKFRDNLLYSNWKPKQCPLEAASTRPCAGLKDDGDGQNQTRWLPHEAPSVLKERGKWLQGSQTAYRREERVIRICKSSGELMCSQRSGNAFGATDVQPKSEEQEGFNTEKGRKSSAGRGNLWANAKSGRESGKGLLKMYYNHRCSMHILSLFIIRLLDNITWFLVISI